jgi:sulfur carrier protein
VRELLRTVGRDGVPCAVEVNRELVPHRQHARHALRAGDRIEVVTLVGGG